MKHRQAKVRVLHLVAGLAIGEPLGGAELFGAELVRHFDQAVCEPVLCAVWRRGGKAEQYWYDKLQNAGIEVFFAADFCGQFSFPAFLKGVQHIADYLESREIDIIHSHFQVGSIAALMLRRRLQSLAILRTAHIMLEWGPTFAGFICRQIFTKWIFPIVFDVETAVSRALTQKLNQRPGAILKRSRAVFVPNGIALDRFKDTHSPTAEQLAALGLSSDKLIVGSVGRLTGQKGYKYLLDAIPTVLEQCPDTQFILVGDGDLRDELQEHAQRLGLDEHLYFLGPRQDVEVLLKMMDVFVLPSLWEGLPTVIMEAMASGIPVVATDIPGTRELVQHGQTGWLVQARNVQTLADRLIEVLNAPLERERVAKRALEEVVPIYSMSSIAEKYTQIYQQILLNSKGVYTE